MKTDKKKFTLQQHSQGLEVSIYIQINARKNTFSSNWYLFLENCESNPK